jgi:hypothetical protein
MPADLDALGRLARLRTSGALTEAEFAAEKAQILGVHVDAKDRVGEPQKRLKRRLGWPAGATVVAAAILAVSLYAHSSTTTKGEASAAAGRLADDPQRAPIAVEPMPVSKQSLPPDSPASDLRNDLANEDYPPLAQEERQQNLRIATGTLPWVSTPTICGVTTSTSGAPDGPIVSLVHDRTRGYALIVQDVHYNPFPADVTATVNGGQPRKGKGLPEENAYNGLGIFLNHPDLDQIAHAKEAVVTTDGQPVLDLLTPDFGIVVQALDRQCAQR